jgi:predicted nucleic acid-binding protein
MDKSLAQLLIQLQKQSSKNVPRPLDLNVDHKLQIWDALILAVAAEQHCRILLTEDMHAGFTWRGVTLVNPFAPEQDPLLEQLLA